MGVKEDGEPGKKVTHHFPEHQEDQEGLPTFDREWHAVEKTWITERDAFYEDGANKHKDFEMKPDTAKAEQEFEFHTAFVKMAALLCASRNRKACDFFQTTELFGFSYTEILAVIQKKERCPSRASYARLMLSLYVDREPYEVNTPAQLTRLVPTLDLQDVKETEGDEGVIKTHSVSSEVRRQRRQSES